MSAKNRRIYLISGVMLFLVITMAAAYVSNQQKDIDPGNETAGKSYYVCSMHPEIIKDAMGDCPICGMSLIEKINQPASDGKKLFVCSMHPEVLMETPGDCPICGMSLIEKISQDTQGADSFLCKVVGSVNVSVLGTAATIRPEEEILPISIESFGSVGFDPRNVHTISARFGGLIERSYVRYQFQPIRKGQKIYQIYCPEIYADGWKYVRLVQAYPDREDLTVEAMQWFKLLGLTDGQIDSLKHTDKPDFHLTVYSDVEGYAVRADFDPEKYLASETEVSKTDDFPFGRGIGFDDGLTVEAGVPLFKIVHLKSLRADLKVRTEDVVLLKKGQQVVFSEEGAAQQYNAIVGQIEPLNGGLFQWVKVFFTDPQLRIIPGRQIRGQILVGNRQSLWVPRTAVLDMGLHQFVFVKEEGRLIATAIKTGQRSVNKIEVLQGIDKDTEIAANALLLTDSDGFITASQQKAF